MIRPEDIHAYVSRDWQRSAAAKRERWQKRRGKMGGEEGTRIGSSLYVHARQTCPNWPSRAERRADLEHHIELVRLLHAVSGS